MSESESGTGNEKPQRHRFTKIIISESVFHQCFIRG